MKILIAVPTYETIFPDTFKSIYGLDRGNAWCVFDFVRGYDCAAARNAIARQAMAEEADYVLMVDNDVVLPWDALVNLLEDPADVCLGYYAIRNDYNIYDRQTSIYKSGEFDYKTRYRADEIQILKEERRKRIQIHGGGMGCALIRTDLFKRLAYPWFKWVNYENGSVLSEDLYFCEMCGQNVIPIYADTRVGCGHLLRHVQWPV